jgi:hypothetical protein
MINNKQNFAINSAKHTEKLRCTAQSFLLVSMLIMLPVALPASAQNSDYKPGQSIKFGASGSSGTTYTVPPVGSGINNSFSGTTYAPPERFSSISAPPTESIYGSGSAQVSGTGANTSTNGQQAAGTNAQQSEKGLGSLVRGIKHELKSVRTDGGSQFSNGYSAGSQFNNSQAPGYGFAGNSQSGALSNGALNYVRMPDGSYRPNGPNVGRTERMRTEASVPRFSGNLVQYVSSDPPAPIDGDIENLLPKELHAKAYGPELRRNAPLNGAEGY